MQIKCLYDSLVKVSELKYHPKNRNFHSIDQIERLAKILDYQGWRYPVKISKQSGYITSGHGRVEAAKLNNWSDVPVNYQDYENTDMEYADVQADNAIASWAELDLKAINIDIPELGPFDIDLLGIKDFTVEPLDKYKLDDIESNKIKDDFVIEVIFPNKNEMTIVYDDLCKQGYIVKVKNG